MHGGRSTGPRTAAGLARSKRAHWTHGRFSAEARQEAAHFREMMRECKEMEEIMACLRERIRPELETIVPANYTEHTGGESL